MFGIGVEPYPDSTLNVGQRGHQNGNRGLLLEEGGTDMGTQGTTIKVIISEKVFFPAIHLLHE